MLENVIQYHKKAFQDTWVYKYIAGMQKALPYPEAEFLEVIGTNVFFLAIHSHLY